MGLIRIDVIITIGSQLQACCTFKLRKAQEMVVHAMHICLLPPDRDMVCAEIQDLSGQHSKVCSGERLQ